MTTAGKKVIVLDSLVARVTFFLIVKIMTVKIRVCGNVHVT